MSIYFLNEEEIRSAVKIEEVIPVIERAFVAYSSQAATVPTVMHIDVPERKGEIHIKAAHIHGAGGFTLKIASGFYLNRSEGLPSSSGLMLLFDARTGFPVAVLLDNAYLTEIRTAAAGAIAAKYMAIENPQQVALIGAGAQGRYQIQALCAVRKFERLLVYDHHEANVSRYINEMKIPAEIQAARSVEQAVAGSRIVVTTTPSRQPYLRAEWIEPGTHITAVGSDQADKQELHVSVLAKADRIIADSISQCLQLGEIHHAVQATVIRREDINGELGDVIGGKITGRSGADEITICDLTGVGVQDAAIAELAFHGCRRSNAGKEI